MSYDWTLCLGIMVEFQLSCYKYSVLLAVGQAATAVNVWAYCWKDLLIWYLFSLPSCHLYRDFLSTTLCAYTHISGIFNTSNSFTSSILPSYTLVLKLYLRLSLWCWHRSPWVYSALCSKKHCKVNLCCYVVLNTTYTKSHALITLNCIS
jgi:hypothetical protein